MFSAKANLQIGNVTVCYCNTQSIVTFDCLWDTQISCEERSNQRIHMDYHYPPPTESGSHQDQTYLVKCDASTPKTGSNQLEKICRQNMVRTNISQIPLQQDIENKWHWQYNKNL